jgi:hypothetical protein
MFFDKLHSYCCLILIFCFSSASHADEIDDLAKTSRELISQFSNQLKTELTAAIKDGGPQNAISKCNLKAPEISSKLSRDGWSIRRTSLKIRNPDNSPDDFEKKILNEFEEKISAGHDINKLAYYKLTEVGTQSEFRYIKAIPVGELCLQCHGEYLSEPVKLKLNALYPDDQAINFKVDDIRGAFTLRKIFKRDVPEFEEGTTTGPIELPQYDENGG